MRDKKETLKKISHSFFQLELVAGHMKWNILQLARASGVSRSIIYRYFGSTKKDIAKNIVSFFIEDFYGFNTADSDKVFKANLPQRVHQTRERMIENYAAISFYHKWRGEGGWIGSELIRIEDKFQVRLKRMFPKLNQKQIKALHAALHGLVTAPFLTPQEAQETFWDLIGLFSPGGLNSQDKVREPKK